MRMFRVVLSLAAVMAISNVPAWAQQAASATAPIPAALYTAKKVFISNVGADSWLFWYSFTGDHDRAYDEFYSDLAKLGRFDLTASPADADLVVELQLKAPNLPPIVYEQKGLDHPLPMFRLLIYDRKSHYVLWVLTESIPDALTQKGHDHNFDTALDILAEKLKTLTTPPAQN